MTRFMRQLSVVIGSLIIPLIPVIYVYFPGIFGRYFSSAVEATFSIFPEILVLRLLGLIRIELVLHGYLENKVDTVEVSLSVCKYDLSFNSFSSKAIMYVI